jgi:hypothetical protein
MVPSRENLPDRVNPGPPGTLSWRLELLSSVLGVGQTRRGRRLKLEVLPISSHIVAPSSGLPFTGGPFLCRANGRAQLVLGEDAPAKKYDYKDEEQGHTRVHPSALLCSNAVRKSTPAERDRTATPTSNQIWFFLVST